MSVTRQVFNYSSLLYIISSYNPIPAGVNCCSGTLQITHNSMISFLIIMLKNNFTTHWIEKVTKYLPIDNLDFMMKLVNINGCMIIVAHSKLKSNYELLKAAISNNGMAMYYADSLIKDDTELAKLSLKSGGQLYYLSERLRSNRDMIIYAANINPKSLTYVTDDWIKYDEDLAFHLIYKRNPKLTSEVLRVSDVPKSNIELSKICIEDLGYEALRRLNDNLKYNKDLIKLCRINYLKNDGYRKRNKMLS